MSPVPSPGEPTAPNTGGPSGGVDVVDRVHRQIQAEPVANRGPHRIVELVRRADPLQSTAEVERAVAGVQARTWGLGPLEDLLADPAVTDVMVNGRGPVWVERAGELVATGIVMDDAAISLAVERILAPLGRRVDPVSPVVDARLGDGSRVHVVVPPVAVDGPCLTIRRFGTRAVPLAEIASPPVARLLTAAVRDRLNVVVLGATGSGKTTLLNALASAIPSGERIITVEDAAELRLPGDHVIRLETRTASVEGVPPITCGDLVRNALRMRPDRLIVGEVRGPEAVDMVQAMSTGHDGSLCTLHANGPDDALRRLETLVLFAGLGLPLPAVRDHLAAAIDLVVHIARQPDGRRRVVEVAEVCLPGPDGPRTRPLTDAETVRCSPTRVRRVGAAPPGADRPLPPVPVPGPGPGRARVET